MVDSTASEAEEIYTHNLEVEADYFGQVFEIDDMSGDTLDVRRLHRQSGKLPCPVPERRPGYASRIGS